jgi:hypothetical protein
MCYVGDGFEISKEGESKNVNFNGMYPRSSSR